MHELTALSGAGYIGGDHAFTDLVAFAVEVGILESKCTKFQTRLYARLRPSYSYIYVLRARRFFHCFCCVCGFT